MNLKTVSWLLIWTGAALLVYGFFMGTTVETAYGEVVNLHLASRKQTLLIAGGVLLICGVLLYGFRKLKQTAEDEAQEAEQRRVAAEAATQRVGHAGQWIEARKDGFLARIKAGLEDRRNPRLWTGILVGLWLGCIASSGVLVLGATVLACTGYALWSRDARASQKRLLYVCTGVTAIAFLMALGSVLGQRAGLQSAFHLADPGYSPFSQNSLRTAEWAFGIVSVGLVTSALALVFVIRATCRERSE